MFDIGFWELSIIGVVALIVIGPERLPGVARTAGLWVGRMRRFVSTVKADIDRELKADELQKVLRQQADSAGVHEIIEETKEAIEGVGKEAAAAADAFDEPPQDYLVKSDKPRYAELKDEDYFEDDETETSVAKVEHSDSSEKKQQENDDRA